MHAFISMLIAVTLLFPASALIWNIILRRNERYDRTTRFQMMWYIMIAVGGIAAAPFFSHLSTGIILAVLSAVAALLAAQMLIVIERQPLHRENVWFYLQDVAHWFLDASSAAKAPVYTLFSILCGVWFLASALGVIPAMVLSLFVSLGFGAFVTEHSAPENKFTTVLTDDFKVKGRGRIGSILYIAVMSFKYGILLVNGDVKKFYLS